MFKLLILTLPKVPGNRKPALFAVALAMLLAFSVFAVIPVASAHDPPYNIPTYAYILVSPNPIGVNQQAIVLMWIDKLNPTAAGIGGGRWQDYTVTITAPDGTVQTLGPFTADPTSTTNALWTPKQVGTYTLMFNFPGGIANLTNPLNGVAGTPSAFVGDYFMPSNATTTVTVQPQQIESRANFPAITGYWNRPVEGELTASATYLSNWLHTPPEITQNVQPFGSAPDSAHIMWAMPVQFGGVVGGSYSSGASKFGSVAPSGMTYYEGMSYEERNPNPIIIQGRLFYALPLSDQPTGGGYVSVDLQTGQQYWIQNYSVNPSFGQLYEYDTINQHGVIPNGYLWATSGSTWIAYDAMTGNWLFNLTGVPRGTMQYGPNGEILSYVIGSNGQWLAEWNNTAAPGELLGGGTGASSLEWRPVGKVIDASTAYSWNVTLPASVPAGSTILDVIPGDLALISTPLTQTLGVQYTGFGTNPYTLWAVSLDSSNLGQTLWTKSYPAPEGNVTRFYVHADPQNNVFVMYDKETFQYWGYSLENGNLIWGPYTTSAGTDMQYFQWSAINDAVIANGNLYVAGWGGVVYCINDATGNLIWTYGNGGVDNSTSSFGIVPYGNYPTFIGAVADGKVYLYNSEHSPIEPPYIGEEIRVLSASSGQELFTLSAWPVSTSFYNYMGAVADGYLTFFNEYDGRMYSVGKGPSATTVSTQTTVVPLGASVLIKGSVTDQSAGAKDTPAISDQDMSAWMAYLYMQHPEPTNATGVPVAITAVGPDGAVYKVGTSTSDMYGNYGITWTPPASGTYEIIADFAGTNSYGSSSASTYLAVGSASAPAPTSTPTPTTPSSSSVPAPSYTLSYGINVIVAVAASIVIIVAVAVVALVLRRRRIK